VEKAFYPIAVLCRVLQVSRSGFYEWAKRKESARGLRNAALTVKVAQAHAKSRGIYGSPRVRDELREGGEVVGRKLVARLMRAQGLQGCRPRRYKATTDSAHGLPVPENLVARDFAPAGPDLLWVADITYIWTWEGWLYLAVVLDLWSRRVVGWSMAEHMRSELVVDALEMALGHRVPAHGHVFHSDRGSQGEFNWSSQRPNSEVLYGKATWVDRDVDGPAGDAVAGSAAGAARSRAEVLGEDRRGDFERGGGDRVRRVRAGRYALVPRGGWHAVDPAKPADRTVLVVRRARRDRAAQRARPRSAGDRQYAQQIPVDDLA
jgi:hypothetical protein